jgi:uncharacterized protein (UPF0264 family)
VTKLLVSVRDAAEAAAALEGGADWIDLKEPSRGALGPVDPDIARQAVALAAGRAPISAAAGELLDWPASPARTLLRVDGIDRLKLGLSLCLDRDWRAAWLSAQREIAGAGKELVAVIYADDAAAQSPATVEIAALAREARCQWLLIDTFDKQSETLLSYVGAAELAELFDLARQGGMMTAAAGRLTAAAIAGLPLEAIDVVAREERRLRRRSRRDGRR